MVGSAANVDQSDTTVGFRYDDHSADVTHSNGLEIVFDAVTSATPLTAVDHRSDGEQTSRNSSKDNLENKCENVDNGVDPGGDKGIDKVLVEDDEDDGLPIDRGWAWAILAGSSVMTFIYGGFGKCVGIFFVQYIQRFNASASEVSVIFTFMNILLSISSIFILTTLTSRIGPRAVFFIGTVFAFLSYLTTAFVVHLEVAFITLGVLTGLAAPMVYFPFMTAIPQYFKRYRGFANSLVSSGASLGGLVIAPLATAIFEEYLFTGAFMIFSAIYLNLFVAGLLLRPIESFRKRRKDKQTPENTPDGNFEKCKVNGERSRTISNNEESAPFLNHINKATPMDHIRRRKLSDGSHGSSYKSSHEQLARSNMDLYASCEVFGGSIVDVRQCADPTILKDSAADLSPEHVVMPRKCCLMVITYLKTVFDPALLKDPVMLTYLCMAFMMLPGIGLVPVYIAPYAKEINISATMIGYLYTIIASIDIASKLCAGFVIDRKWVKGTTLVAIAGVGAGVASQLVRFMTSIASIMILVVVTGLCCGIYISTFAVILADIVDLRLFNKAMGLVALVHGVSMAVIFPLIGLLRDETNTYVMPFHAIGVFAVIGSAFALAIPHVKSWSLKRDKSGNELNHDV